MHKKFHIALRLSCALFVLSGFLALLTTGRYDGSLILLPLLLFVLAPLGEWLDTRYQSYRNVMNIAAAGYALTLIGPFVEISPTEAVTRLVIMILAYRFLHRKQEYEYEQIFLMTFFLLLSAYAQSPNASFGLVLPLFMTSAVWVFLSLQIHAEFDRNASAARADIVPSRASSLLFHTGKGKDSYGGFLISTAVISLLSLVLAAVAFIAVPRVGGGFFFAGTSGEVEMVTGLSSTVNLATGGTITPDTRAVMHVQFPDEPGGQYHGPMYWRATSLSSYIENTWGMREADSRIGEEQARIRFEFVESGFLVRSETGRGRGIKQVIFADDAHPHALPCLSVPVSVEARDQPFEIDWSRRADNTIETRGSGRRSLQYSVISEVQEPTPAELRASGDDYAGTLTYQALRLLTRQNLSPLSQETAQRITEDASTVYDKVKTIEDYFAGNNFYYTLDLPSVTGKPVDVFLNETRLGHCELFASAMALMVRSLGIPARVASGYRGGQWNPSDRSYTVRADMAHLWVEVYFLGRGWARFDPSPPEEGLGGAPLNRFQLAVARYTIRSKMLWYHYVIGYDPWQVWSGVQQWGSRLAGGGSHDNMGLSSTAAVSHAPRAPRVWFRLLLAGLAAGGCLLLVLSLRSARRRRYRLTSDQLRAVRLYRRVIARIERGGITCRGKTVEEICAEITCGNWRDADDAQEILTAYNNARFGGGPLSPGTYAVLRKRIRRLRLSAPPRRQDTALPSAYR